MPAEVLQSLASELWTTLRAPFSVSRKAALHGAPRHPRFEPPMGFTPSPGPPIRGVDPGRVQRDRQVWSWRTGRAHLMARLARWPGAQVGDFGVLAPGLCSEQVSCIWKQAQTSLQQTSYSYRTSCRTSSFFWILFCPPPPPPGWREGGFTRICVAVSFFRGIYPFFGGCLQGNQQENPYFGRSNLKKVRHGQQVIRIPMKPPVAVVSLSILGSPEPRVMRGPPFGENESRARHGKRLGPER